METLASIDLTLALNRLTDRADIQKLLNLEIIRTDPSVAKTPNYQRAFNHYYRVQRKRSAFYEAFYSVFEAAASAAKPPLLKNVMVELFDRTGERHLSFSSKLVATLDCKAAIYDRNVAALLGISTKPLDPKNWLEEALGKYSELTSKMNALINDPGWPTFAGQFDNRFPVAAHLSPVRKADLILWSAFNDKPGERA